ncbi:MAG: isochorismatase family protein [Opitutae bacterium]|nr:isochorismatase family protein [Opitutae bacterium]
MPLPQCVLGIIPFARGVLLPTSVVLTSRFLFMPTLRLFPLLSLVSIVVAAEPTPQAMLPDAAFLKDCVFVCIDIQEPGSRTHMTDAQVPKEWQRMGITAADANAATDYAFDVAFPNAERVVAAVRGLGVPMVFVHWGCRFADGMDLDPAIRNAFIAEHGPDYTKWHHHEGDPGTEPAKFLHIREGEYVIPKSGQDAFNSSNIRNVLVNLGAKHLIMIGGHTGACLGKIAASAKRAGYRLLCIEDATFDARQSTRRRWIDETGYDYVLGTDEFLAWLAKVRR